MVNRLLIFILFTVVSVTWGSTWIAMKLALLTIPPLFATAARFLITAPILMVIAICTRKPLLFPPKKKMFQFIIFLFYFLLPFTLMLYGGTYVSSSLASMIFATMPVLILMFSILIMKEPICTLKIIGLVISLTSLLIILVKELNINSINQVKGTIALLLAVTSHAIVYAKSKKEFSSLSVFTLNTLPSLFSGIILLIISIIFEQPNILNFSIKSIVAILYLGIVSGVFGILSYFYLQTKVSLLQASMIFLIFPFISLFLENQIFGYIISIYMLFMSFPLIFGILITLLPCDYLKIIRFNNDK
ncbi:EamA-like transporter family protein [Buchnera aphidicola (Eriosoma lanigerum)]|uniref:DMT family transporter n=1 Tax=Buchnera aphidicola TaxID=9 RepID=UPI003A6D498C